MATKIVSKQWKSLLFFTRGLRICAQKSFPGPCVFRLDLWPTQCKYSEHEPHPVLGLLLPCHVVELDTLMGVSFGMHFFFLPRLAWLFGLSEWVSYTREQLNWFVAYAYCSHLKSFSGISEGQHLILPLQLWDKGLQMVASALVLAMNFAALWGLPVLPLPHGKGWDLG